MDKIEIRHFTAADRDWLLAQHRDHYARVEGFDASFGRLVAQILDDFLRNHDPTCERGWIAWRGEARLGSIFCVRLDETRAKLRLFLLVPEARGRGLGHRLLQSCIRFARAQGSEAMQLWTHESHRAAGALYARTGWQLTDSRPVISFGKPNVEQTWEILL
ncbi:GNAT family N-acetyltransferase [Sulfitobacter sp. PS-8MA]|uniref:GNAT family N-acetyltransferase n=1 Tax=Sulfitobacter sp. PS-8MA TaxID=3237707 RepID=UPI0034C5D1E8